MTNDYCAVARPIYPSRYDTMTPLTKRQILDHNEIGERQCGWK